MTYVEVTLVGADAILNLTRPLKFPVKAVLVSLGAATAAIAAVFAAIFVFSAASVIVEVSLDWTATPPEDAGASSRKSWVSKPPDSPEAPDEAAGSHFFAHRLAIV